MTYATDILSDAFSQTKNLFFPIRKEYWIRMGFISLFSSSSRGGSGNSGYNTSSRDFSSGLNFREVLSQFNTKALEFLSEYGTLVTIVFVILYAVSLIFSYLNSVFIFVFIEGIVKKDVRIIKSFKNNSSKGVSLFFLRLLIGLFSLVVVLLILSPIIMAFFTNALGNFNFWILIPIFLLLILFGLIMGFFWFLVYDFVVPIMYLRKLPFSKAWRYFVNKATKKKLEIFLYWLVKLGLSIASIFIYLILFIPMLILLGIFILLAILLYLVVNAISGATVAVIITSIIGFFLIMIWIFILSVISVPIPAFFRIYSIEMVKKLESVNKI